MLFSGEFIRHLGRIYDLFDTYPAGGPWQLLLQLQEVGMPFEINFGSDGTGYALLSEDGRTGKFLWMR